MICKICDREQECTQIRTGAWVIMICDLCKKKLYYHFRDIINKKIEHP